MERQTNGEAGEWRGRRMERQANGVAGEWGGRLMKGRLEIPGWGPQKVERPSWFGKSPLTLSRRHTVRRVTWES
jgi:hypothetical protein